MLEGLTRFRGPVLFIMSGKSLVSREFDELATRSEAWQAVVNRRGYRRVELADADQAFSSAKAKVEVNEAVLGWLQDMA